MSATVLTWRSLRSFACCPTCIPPEIVAIKSSIDAMMNESVEPRRLEGR